LEAAAAGFGRLRRLGDGAALDGELRNLLRLAVIGELKILLLEAADGVSCLSRITTGTRTRFTLDWKVGVSSRVVTSPVWVCAAARR